MFAIQLDGYTSATRRRVDRELGLEVIDRLQIEQLTIREAEGDVEEPPVVLRGDPDAAAVLRSRDCPGRALDGELLTNLAVADRSGIDNCAGIHQDADFADNEQLADIVTIDITTEVRVSRSCQIRSTDTLTAQFDCRQARNSNRRTVVRRDINRWIDRYIEIRPVVVSLCVRNRVRAAGIRVIRERP